jgi:hypothetical protein
MPSVSEKGIRFMSPPPHSPPVNPEATPRTAAAGLSRVSPTYWTPERSPESASLRIDRSSSLEIRRARRRRWAVGHGSSRVGVVANLPNGGRMGAKAMFSFLGKEKKLWVQSQQAWIRL